MIKDFCDEYTPMNNYYKVKMHEKYMFRHIYRDYGVDVTQNEINAKFFGTDKLKRLIILYNYEVNIMIYCDSGVISEGIQRIPNVFEEQLMDELNKLNDTNYEMLNVYYRKSDDPVFYHVPDFIPPKINRNTVYHKLRLNNYDTVCVKIKI
jgi:hypothetical protein